MIFDKVIRVYCQLQKRNQKLFLVPLQVWSSPSILTHKNPLFQNTKLQISLEPMVQIEKVSPFWDPLIEGLLLSYNWILFEKIQICYPVYLNTRGGNITSSHHTAQIATYEIAVADIDEATQTLNAWCWWNLLQK